MNKSYLTKMEITHDSTIYIYIYIYIYLVYLGSKSLSKQINGSFVAVNFILIWSGFFLYVNYRWGWFNNKPFNMTPEDDQ